MVLDYLKWLNDAHKYLSEKLLGEKVSIEQGDERKAMCLGCDMLREKQILPTVSIKICGCCKCPIDTKPYYHTHILAAINPLTEKDENNIETVRCCHEKVDKWKEIDTKYNKIE